MSDWIHPAKWRPGDKVAVLAPSSSCAAIFPQVRDLGIKRLQDLFHVEPVVYPTMNSANNSDEARASDLMAAFSDPSIKGIVCSIGGEDLIRILPRLDVEVIRANPKIVLGFSDITSLHLILFRQKIVSFYGGNLLCQFGLGGASMHDFTLENFKNMLLATDTSASPLKWSASPEKLDAYLPWGDPVNVDKTAPLTPNEGWVWKSVGVAEEGAAPVIGRLWGGCLDTLFGHLAVRKYLPEELLLSPKTKEDKLVLFIETSEVMAPTFHVYSFFQTLGEMGLIDRFGAVLVGRPKTVTHDGLHPAGGVEQYIQHQRAAVLRGLGEYVRTKESPPVPSANSNSTATSENSSSIPVVFNVDFGHTDPQLIVPSGSMVTIDHVAETIEVVV